MRTPSAVLDLAAFARHGVIRRADLIDAGMSAARWSRLHHSGQLVAVYPGVSRLPEVSVDRRGRIAAAMSWAGPYAIVSHRTAAALWGVTRPDDEPVDLLVPLDTRRTAPTGVSLHRTRVDTDLAPSRRDGFACTNPLRTLGDLGAVDPGGVGAAFEELVVAGFVDRAAVVAALQRSSRQGKHGCDVLRRVLEDWPLHDHRPDSRLEIRLARLLTNAGLGNFEFHRVIEGFEVDFAFGARRLVVETDGFEHHGTREAFERDRTRDLRLAAAGWRVVRVTWLAIEERPTETIELIRRALAVGP